MYFSHVQMISCACRYKSTEDPIPTTNKLECLTTIEDSGFEDISEHCSTSEGTEENQTILQKCK